MEESLVTLEKKAEKRKTGSDYHSFERDVSLSHSQRDLVAQEVGVMHQVSYSSSVSTFCRNEIKDRNYKSANSIFSFPFLFQEKNGWKFSTAPLNHSREKE